MVEVASIFATAPRKLQIRTQSLRDIDTRDAISGGLLTLLGASTAVYSSLSYELGTPLRMGPGLMPTILGVLLACLGLLIFVPAMFRKGPGVVIRYKVLGLVLLSIAAFAVLAQPFGLVPAIVAMTLISTFADGRLHPLAALGLGLALSALGVAIFVFGLNTPLPIIRWPF